MFDTLSNTVGELVHHTTAYLTRQSQIHGVVLHSPSLESRMIITHVLGISNTEIVIHPERLLHNTQENNKKAFEMAHARCLEIPMAYLTEEREFYGHTFSVNTHVLIPRPETELIVDIALTIIEKETDTPHIAHRILDCGTGSGCIGISLALQHPHWEIILNDIDDAALAVAEQNSRTLLGRTLPTYKSFLISHVLEEKTNNIGIIIANLPYVCPHELPYTHLVHEPKHALTDGSPDGLALIFQLIAQTNTLSYPHYLILEIDPLQVDSITRMLAHTQYTHINSHLDLSKRTRFLSCSNLPCLQQADALEHLYPMR